MEADGLRRQAHAGDPEAQADLAWRLMRGEGVEKDPEQAVHWMGRAAAHGIVDAQYQAGIWLELLGRAEEGQAWLARAAEQGDARARACLPPGP